VLRFCSNQAYLLQDAAAFTGFQSQVDWNTHLALVQKNKKLVSAKMAKK